MKTTIGYRPGRYQEYTVLRDHPDCLLLYGGLDTVTSLELCPFPLKTDTFEVLLFGDYKNECSKTQVPDCSEGKWAVVEYVKSCGHRVQERIPFFENVQTFTHYGDVFEGSSYSVNAWEERIEFFRTILPCAVCQLVYHAAWIYKERLAERGKEKCIVDCLQALEANFDNWRDFMSEAEVRGQFDRLPPAKPRSKSIKQTLFRALTEAGKDATSGGAADV